MAKILISNSFPTQPIVRQLPSQHGGWHRHDFAMSPFSGRVSPLQDDPTPYDAWVVYDDLLVPETRRCARNRTLLITGEPPSVRKYRPPFGKQFGNVRSSHPTMSGAKAEITHEAQPWHYGMVPCNAHHETLTYDALNAMHCPSKTKLLSVISSNKVVTEDHRQRLRFVDCLKTAFGDQVDVFGRGIRDIPDKADAIWNYKYHIVLENDHSPFYMSEKLPDGFLGWSFPFYSGGPFADGIFAPGSFARIDMYRPDDSIAIIRSVIQENAFEQRMELISQSRKVVLDEINLFAVISRTVDGWLAEQNTKPQPPKQSPITLWPKKRSIRLTFHRMLRAVAAVS
jgi:hypothetical protein